MKIDKEDNKVLKEQVTNCKMYQKQLSEKNESHLKTSKTLQQKLDELTNEISKLKDENKQLINHQILLRTKNADLKQKLNLCFYQQSMKMNLKRN